MKSKEELIEYMSSNIQPFHAKDLDSAQRILGSIDVRDPFYQSIKDYVDMIICARFSRV